MLPGTHAEAHGGMYGGEHSVGKSLVSIIVHLCDLHPRPPAVHFLSPPKRGGGTLEVHIRGPVISTPSACGQADAMPQTWDDGEPKGSPFPSAEGHVHVYRPTNSSTRPNARDMRARQLGVRISDETLELTEREFPVTHDMDSASTVEGT